MSGDLMLSPEAEQLILRFEGGSDRLEWPEGNSGVTAACGYDFGYHRDDEIVADWAGRVPDPVLTLLVNISGLKGQDAGIAARSSTYAAVRIPYATSLAVFRDRTLPKFEAETLRAFPGSGDMPALSFGALVSLVYNRGASCDPNNPRRAEMAAIRRCSQDKAAWGEIPQHLAAMTRLWPGVPTDSNLPGRRLAEAALFVRGLRNEGLADSRILVQGDSGPAVSSLQAALVAAMANLPVDGEFGPKTRQAVWRYQLAWQLLPASGIADLRLRKSLGLP